MARRAVAELSSRHARDRDRGVGFGGIGVGIVLNNAVFHDFVILYKAVGRP